MKKRMLAALALALVLAVSGCAAQTPVQFDIDATAGQTAELAGTPEMAATPDAVGAHSPAAMPTPAPTQGLQASGITPIPQATETLKPTATPTTASKPTAAPTATPKPTAAPTATPKPTATPTATPKPTAMPTATPTATPKPTADPTATSKPTATPTATPKPTVTPTATPKPTSAPNLSYEEQVVELVNEIRAENGLNALKLNAKLSDVARAKSQDMHDLGYFAHESPTYGSPFEMMTSFGISWRAAGENIAMGYSSPQSVVDAWMNSSGHRANILGGSFTEIGVGYVKDGHYWTQMFIGT